MFQVYDTYIPADVWHHDVVGDEWTISIFQSFEAAQAYATFWLGPKAPRRPLALNEKFYYTPDRFVCINPA